MAGTIREVTELAGRLAASGIHYRLDSIRPEAIMFLVAVPGERWEIEVLDTGEIEIEVFSSTGEIQDGAYLATLFERFRDSDLG